MSSVQEWLEANPRHHMELHVLFAAGLQMAIDIVAANRAHFPGNPYVERRPLQRNCGLYESRHDRITVDLPKCAHVGWHGRSWSYPGYPVNRTPHGVVIHELGHAWHLKHPLGGVDILRMWKGFTMGEQSPTSYGASCTGEDIAESFRVYVTNPELTRILWPERFAIFDKLGLRPVETRAWEEILGLSGRHLRAAQNKVMRARRT